MITVSQKNFNITLVVITVWVLLWFLYNAFVRSMYPNPKLDDPLTKFSIELPSFLKCNIKNVSKNPKDNDCNKENLDGWSIAHFFIYYSIGLFVPNAHLLMLIISYICESWEYFMGWRARWIADPLTNLLGYHIGTLHANSLHPKFPLDIPGTNMTTIGLSVFLLGILQLNHPNLVVKG
jgi:hypothetical protein